MDRLTDERQNVTVSVKRLRAPVSSQANHSKLASWGAAAAAAARDASVTYTQRGGVTSRAAIDAVQRLL